MANLNPNGTGDWIAYSLRDGIATIKHRGTATECTDAVLRNPTPPLYVKRRPK